MAHADKTAPSNPIAAFFKIEGTAIALVFLLLVALFMLTAPRAFMGYRVYMSFMANVPPPMIIALGLTLVVVAGEMDLSFPSIVAFASYVFCQLYQSHDMTWLALAAALATGTAMGFVNGLVVTKLGIPSLIATLAMLFLWGGLVTVVSNGASLAIPDIQGSAIHAVFAGNIELFTVMGLLSAFAGVLLTLETTTYFSQAGMGYLLTVVAAVFIGGTSIFGGAGKVFGTVFGSLTRFFIGLVFIVSVTMNAALEDPDKVPLLKDLRSRARE